MTAFIASSFRTPPSSKQIDEVIFLEPLYTSSSFHPISFHFWCAAFCLSMSAESINRPKSSVENRRIHLMYYRIPWETVHTLVLAFGLVAYDPRE
jgi:hypothetical protein